MATATKKVRDGSTMPRSYAHDYQQARRNAAIKNAVLVDGRPQVDVGRRFGLAQCTVSQIVNNPNSHLYR